MYFTPAPHTTQHWRLEKPGASGARGVVVAQSRNAAEAGVAFVVLLTRSADREQISAVYPGAKIDKIHSFASQEPLWFYTVGADEVRQAWEKKNR